MSDTWHSACELSDISEGQGLELVVNDQMVALFRVGEAVYALDGLCPHQGGPLGKGKLVGCIVTCPWHGWQFDVATGQHQTSKSLRHTTLEAKVVDGKVLLKFPAVP